MNRALAAACVAVAAFAARAQVVEEVPFIVTPDNVTLEMLRIAGVGPQDHVIDLGSGDGRIVITAARRFGASGFGVDIDPDLVKRSNRNAQEAGVAAKVSFREQDLFQTDLAPATVVTMYLLQEVNLQLRPRLLQLKPGTRIVSHDWDMGDWKPDRTVVVPVPDKQVGLEKSSKVHLWTVPAQVAGLWCAAGGARLELRQRYQEVEGTVGKQRNTQPIMGRMEGAVLRSALVLDVQGDRARVVDASAPLTARRGQVFVRTAAPACPRSRPAA